MPFPAGTILAKIDPVDLIEDDDGKPVNAVTHSLNKLKVIGPSPVANAEPIPDWEFGEKGDGWIVQPVDYFASNQIAPESALMRDYEVESYPEESLTETEINPAKARAARLESPEDQFAKAARETLKTAKSKTAAKA